MIQQETQARLIKKYDVPAPRYTSYPTVPHWNTNQFTVGQWESAVKQSFHESNNEKGISLYIHLPFCESLCTYCACNTRITKNHRVESTYIRSLVDEWATYKSLFNAKPLIRELHLGGGTPTFFSAANLDLLLKAILEGCDVHPQHEFSFEGHPNNTTREHLQVLYNNGFRRVSYGVQDLDEKVQRTINRIQPLENLQFVTDISREIGYQSISYDLIYGLPHQTIQSVNNTIEKVLRLRPDRISFYGYAHVPWIKPGQRGYEDADLPSDVAKRELYETGRNLLRAAGYHDVGMDHFALAHDSMFLAMRNGTLHRNFMGYTTSQTDLLIGLGTSAISDAKYAYAQNLKKVEAYSEAVASQGLAVFKGHIQAPEDLRTRKIILDIACNGYVRQEAMLAADTNALGALSEMCDEEILSPRLDGLQVTERGRAFIRNICALFDRHLQAQQANEKKLFSQAI